MSAPALGEFRSLLTLFRESDLRDLSASARNWSVFFARPDGSPYLPASNGPSSPAANTPTHRVTAGHLGVVAELLPLGSTVAIGERVAELAVLDDRRLVLADRAGTVSAHLSPAGQLVEYGQALLEIV